MYCVVKFLKRVSVKETVNVGHKENSHWNYFFGESLCDTLRAGVGHFQRHGRS